MQRFLSVQRFSVSDSKVPDSKVPDIKRSKATIEDINMTALQWFNNSLTYISEAVARIFGPDQDSYPLIGVQPFDGDPYRGWKDA